MKFLIFLLVGAGAVTYIASNNRGREQAAVQPPVLVAAPAKPKAPSGPTLHFGGVITQHTPHGALVRCDSWKPYLNEGHSADEVTGDFFLSDCPFVSQLHDDAEIEFLAVQSGLVEYTTVTGANRTVRHLVYAGLPASGQPAQPAPPKPGTWMQENHGALDQPSAARRGR